jgi:hypothetical protein
VFMKIYGNEGPYKEGPAFDDIRPKLVSWGWGFIYWRYKLI